MLLTFRIPLWNPLLICVALPVALLAAIAPVVQAQKPEPRPENFARVRATLVKYCVSCHSAKERKGSLDLERYATLADVRQDFKPWQQLIEQVETGEMPPKKHPQPTDAEKTQLLTWTREFLDAEARATTGDPGRVPLRRLSNAEYDNTIRDLTGVDLKPTREFPADGAAGEGFTNAAEALTDISPALLTKYLAAAKDVADHAVLVPDGIRFSTSKTRRDWTTEATDRLRKFYAKYATADGRLSVSPYLLATVRHRVALRAGQFEGIAAKEKLNAKYLVAVWQALTDSAMSQPLAGLRAKWDVSVETDVPALAADIAFWQGKLWATARVGSYMRPDDTGYTESPSRQVPLDPAKTDACGNAAFRTVFPLFTCFPNVVPTDEVVSLKMFHREDEPLQRLFLSDAEKAKLEMLWTEHQFVSRQAVLENDYLPQFIGFVTQDQPKAMELFFLSLKPKFQARADGLLKAEAYAIVSQLNALLTFADRAYRRPLSGKKKSELLSLYKAIRAKGAGHDEAIRGVLTRVLIAPAFLFRTEAAPPGKEPGAVSDHELATRLSYFLWGSLPDAELSKLADEGRLREPKVLMAQAQRMLKDDKLRALAVEFGTQWLHVRNFDEFNEKNEKLFPTFDKKLRAEMNEEAVRFFVDLFQQDRPVLNVLTADYAFLNESLAKHYGIPGVSGPQFRKVDGVRKYGRGGVLGFGSVQAKQSGASRTSPVLRGNWVVETLLGEKLPRPPKDVPQLPEAEGIGGLTTRQQVERHAKEASCAACHARIDPFGFALEKYDAVGRLRTKDLGGLPVDATAKLKDGTAFDGLDGLRDYLLTKKKDVIVRLFCKRLLGYALGRSVTLSDTALLDEMVSELAKNDGKVSAAVFAILRSPQFTKVRGVGMED